jgi:hypothetical protein
VCCISCICNGDVEIQLSIFPNATLASGNLSMYAFPNAIPKNA